MRKIGLGKFEFLEISSDTGRSVTLFVDDPCVCGRAKTLRACCARTGNLVLPGSPASTTPALPATGFSHPRCYAGALADCSTKISREHIFSENVQRRFAASDSAKTLRVIHSDGRTLELPPTQLLAANILCTRHNPSLSLLDAAAGLTFSAFREGARKTQKQGCFMVHDVDFERWILKVACGVRFIGGEPVPIEWLRVLFGYEEFAPPRGFRMHVPSGQSVHSNEGLQFGTYRSAAGQSGAEITFDGVRFTLDITGEGRTHLARDVGALEVYRPLGLWFVHGDRTTFHLGFEWGNRFHAATAVTLNVERRSPPRA